MLKIIILFMMVFMSLEAFNHPIFKTGQTQSFDASGTEVTDDSIKDDGYYQTGVRQRYTRNEATKIVTDEVTGLEWQDDDAVKDNNQTWADIDGYCSTLDLNGEIGWRLPTIEELETLLDNGKSSLTLSSVFNNISSSGYWSSTTDVSNNSSAWRVHFYYGSTGSSNKINSWYVRCVRGGQLDNLNFSRDTDTETVWESKTNLQWQDDGNVSDANNVKNWTEAIEYCENLTMANQTDWRLPTINELTSIVDRSRVNSEAIVFIFANISSDNNYSSGYWSSTTRARDTSDAWYVYFNAGGTYYNTKTDSKYVRCVRGGQLDNLKLKSLTKTGQTKSYGEDGSEVTDGSIKDDGYYQAGFTRSYTRDDTAKIVTDNTTKLEWQDDDSVTSNDQNWTEANSYCSTLDLNGVQGWRLPSKGELESIVDRGKVQPSINDVFTNIPWLNYWSSTVNESNTAYVWHVSFTSGSSGNNLKSNDYKVRCVRGGEFEQFNFTRDDTTEIVTDNVTSLQWQDNGEVNTTQETWIDAIEYCEDLDMASQTDWRLPNQNELLSIVDVSKYNSAFNSEFVNFSSTNYWSATTYSDVDNSLTSYAWSVLFYNGNSSNYDKVNSYSVRCVRGGEVESKTITVAPVIMYLLN